MRKSQIVSAIVMIVVTAGAAVGASDEVNDKLAMVQAPFISNEGQIDKRVKFYARMSRGTAYITKAGAIVYDLPKVHARNGRLKGWTLREELAGAVIRSIEGEGQAATVSHYVGRDRSKWKALLPSYSFVTIREVYEGIDLRLKVNGGSVEKIFYVKPGAKPEDIRLKVSGANKLKMNNNGELEAETGLGTVVFTRPKAFQIFAGQTREVDVAYVTKGKEYGFNVGPYDLTSELVIDPIIQATYVGGTAGDSATTIAYSGSNVYVGGSTQSATFPGVSGGAQTSFAGSTDGFVALLTSDLKSLVQVTFLGGSLDDTVQSIVPFGSNLYVGGQTTSTDFPATTGGARPNNAGGARDAFVAVLTSDLKSLTQATYFGGNNDDFGVALAVAGSGPYSVFLAGSTSSRDLVGTLFSAQPLNGNPQTLGSTNDGFIAVFTSDLKTLTKSTYLGGRGNDSLLAMALTPGFLYVTGSTDSEDFPKAYQGFQPVNGGGQVDAFVAILTSDLTTLTTATYAGGSGNDLGAAIAVAGSDVFIAGETSSLGFPGTIGGFQPTLAGLTDGFVARLNSSLTSLIRATYLGTAGFDRVSDLAIGDSFFGPVVYAAGLVGLTVSPPYDGFLIGMNPNLVNPALNFPYASFTFLAGSGSDFATAIALPPPIFGFNIYVAGSTGSTDFSATAGGARAAGDGADGFAAKVVLVADYAFAPISPISMVPGSSASATVTLQSLNGLEELIKLAVSSEPNPNGVVPLPAGFTPSFLSPGDEITPPKDGSISTTLVLNASQAVPAGAYTFWVVGLPGTSVAHATPVNVNVVTSIPLISGFIADLTTVGCIDNAGISTVLRNALAAAQREHTSGKPRNAINTLNAVINTIEAQKGLHIATSCTLENVTFEPAPVLITDIQVVIGTINN